MDDLTLPNLSRLKITTPPPPQSNNNPRSITVYCPHTAISQPDDSRVVIKVTTVYVECERFVYGPYATPYRKTIDTVLPAFNPLCQDCCTRKIRILTSLGQTPTSATQFLSKLRHILTEKMDKYEGEAEVETRRHVTLFGPSMVRWIDRRCRNEEEFVSRFQEVSFQAEEQEQVQVGEGADEEAVAALKTVHLIR